MTKRIGLIPAAGKGLRFGEISKRYPKSLLPIDGRPILLRNVELLTNSGCEEVYLLVHKDDYENVLSFVEFFDVNEQVVVCPIGKTIGPGDTIASGLKIIVASYEDAMVDIVLSDIVPEQEAFDTFIERCTAANVDGFSYNDVSDWERWCMVGFENMRIKFYDKPTTKPKTSMAMSGIYHIHDAKLALESCQAHHGHAMFDREFQISDLLIPYLEARKQEDMDVVFNEIPLKDFGTLREYLDNRGVPGSREFNQIAVDKNTVTKTCTTNPEKVYREACWLKSVPPEIAPLTPRIYESRGNSYTMERIDLPTLRELYVYADNSIETWEPIIDTLMETLKLMESFVGAKKADPMKAFLARIGERVPASAGANYAAHMKSALGNMELWHNESIRCSTVYHGDLCMSNIFYNMDNNSIKVIDPRGEMFGSIYYDAAKLMHSFIGLYDIVDSEMYVRHGNTVRLYSKGKFKIAELFWKKLHDIFEEDEVIFILGVCAGLFLTMIPLHYHNKTNQAIFYEIHCWLFDCFLKKEMPKFQDNMEFVIDETKIGVLFS